VVKISFLIYGCSLLGYFKLKTVFGRYVVYL